jgi:hypothetical protein
MNSLLYGFIGSFLSFIYFSNRIADFGSTPTITPFFHIFTQSKSSFYNFFIKKLITPFAITLAISLVIATFIFSFQKTPANIPLLTTLTAIPFLIFLESIRYLERAFLNTAFKSKFVVTIELASFSIYLGTIWIPHFINKTPITLNNIILAHSLDSLLSVGAFSLLLLLFYKNLPQHSASNEPKLQNFTKRLWKTKLLNFVLKTSKDLFSSNFLTPIFAMRVGFNQVGIFYFASTLATSIQSIIKVGINHPTSALLANLKQHPPIIKKHAFSLISYKLTALITPLAIFILLNYKLISKVFFQRYQITELFTTFLCFQLITILEFFFMIYEQFYIAEEQTHKILPFKLMEITAFFIVLTFNSTSSIQSTLIMLALIRIICLFILAATAYRNWQIKLQLFPSKKVLIGSTALAFIFFLIFSLI